jgi:hypothetical protein
MYVLYMYPFFSPHLPWIIVAFTLKHMHCYRFIATGAEKSTYTSYTSCEVSEKWVYTVRRKKIRLMEGNKKGRQLKSWPVKDFAAGVYLLEAQNPIPPPPHTVYVYPVYLFTQGKGGGGRGGFEPERRLEEQQFTKLGRTWLTISPVYKLDTRIFTKVAGKKCGGCLRPDRNR